MQIDRVELFRNLIDDKRNGCQFLAEFGFGQGMKNNYVREIARGDGKPKPKLIKQVYLGPPERLLALIKGDWPGVPVYDFP